MFVDLLGKTRIKMAVHVSPSNGKSKFDIAEEYLEHDYDVIAMTENWKYTPDCELSGIKVISGCEYSVGGLGDGEEAYHIIGIGMTSEPEIPSAWQNMKKTARAKAAEIIKMIQKRNGIAIIAYPVHNKNSADVLLDLEGFDGIEIFNSEIDYGAAGDGYFGRDIDRLNAFCVSPVLVASNGVSCYDDEEYICSIMVEATDMDRGHILRALRQGRFYATEGPEIHIERIGADRVRVTCSPAQRLEFFSDMGHTSSKTVDADDIISDDYVIRDGERFVRAEITDRDGLRAWSNTVRFDDIYR